MFGFRTPVKAPNADVHSDTESPMSPAQAGPSRIECTKTTQNSKVRRSIGEWEAGKAEPKPKTTTTSLKTWTAEPPKAKTKTTLVQDSKAGSRRSSVETTISPTKEKSKYIDRLTEARACVAKAKLNLGNSRNTKTEIKNEVLQAIDRLYQLVKEAQTAKVQENKKPQKDQTGKESVEENGKEENKLIKTMEEHARLIRDNNEKMEKLKETIEKQQEAQQRQTYASVAAAFTRRQAPEQTALHSVVVTSKDEMETGEEVLNRIRNVVNAKEGGIAVERIRKAKDQKVIVGCRTEEERQILKERLKRAEDQLNVQDIKNKDPLVILRDVFQYNTDEDILSALKNQNRNLLKDIDTKEQKMEIMYKKRTKNPHTHHIILRVSTKIWQRLVDAGTVQIDLQRVKVADQSPLVQCSLCLGYGHGKRFCAEKIAKCSHCGGPHMRTECADWLAGETPSCCNCTHAKIDRTDHNAFSQDCSIRKKWEALARATVAYC